MSNPYGPTVDHDAAEQGGDMFDEPVDVPVAELSDGPFICIQFNRAYGPIVALALQRLLYYDAWTGDIESVGAVIAAFDTLIGQFSEDNCP
jgi:hypothetical protein